MNNTTKLSGVGAGEKDSRTHYPDNHAMRLRARAPHDGGPRKPYAPRVALFPLRRRQPPRMFLDHLPQLVIALKPALPRDRTDLRILVEEMKGFFNP